MADKEKILKAIEESMEELKTVDENIIGECIGVSHALGDLRKTLDEIDVCLDKRRYSEASNLGYRDVSSAFVFLQRTLGGLQNAYTQKEKLVSEIALKSGVRVYEKVEPFVDDILESSKELPEAEKRKNKKRISEILKTRKHSPATAKRRS